MAIELYLANLVQVLDRWVIVVSALVVAYLIYNFRRFYRKYVALSYILVLTLFIFWSVRAILTGGIRQPPLTFWIMSFLLDLTVIVYAAAIVYHYEDFDDFSKVKKLFGLQHAEQEQPVQEYEGPDLEQAEPGTTYLVLEQGQAYQWELFDALTEHLPGLAFSRGHPSRIDLDVDAEDRDITYYWFSSMPQKGDYKTIDPFRRGAMEDIIEQFVEDNDNPVVLIDSLEYLFYKNSPEAIIDFVQHLHEALANRHDVTLIFSVEKGAINRQHLTLLQEEVEEVRTMQDDGTVETRRY